MKEMVVPCRRGDTERLLAHLRGKVFHLTSLSAYRAIRETGKILHNKDSRFDLNTSSENSFGRLMGYVCLFDLRNDSPDLIQHVLSCYYFLDPLWFQKQKGSWIISELAYLLLNPSFYDKIVPNSRAGDHYNATEQWLQRIPRGEVWMEDHVPLEWVDTVILTRRVKRAPAPNSLLGLVQRIKRKEFKSMSGLEEPATSVE